MRIKIGVMGSASGPTIESQENIKKAIELGHYIAQAGCVLVNGACPGLPDQAAFGAHQTGGFVMGVSPAFSEKEHTERYKSPRDYYDILLYTGMGLMERDIINIRSSDAIIIAGGGIGSLNEFTVAYDEGKIVGILTESGGISNHIPEILQVCDRTLNEKILFHSDPKTLVNKVLEAIEKLPQPVREDERIVGVA